MTNCSSERRGGLVTARRHSRRQKARFTELPVAEGSRRPKCFKSIKNGVVWPEWFVGSHRMTYGPLRESSVTRDTHIHARTHTLSEYIQRHTIRCRRTSDELDTQQRLPSDPTPPGWDEPGTSLWPALFLLNNAPPLGDFNNNLKTHRAL